jgi:hypothetical protein
VLGQLKVNTPVPILMLYVLYRTACRVTKRLHITSHSRMACIMTFIAASALSFEQQQHVGSKHARKLRCLFLSAADIEPKCGTVRPSMETNVLIVKTQLGKVCAQLLACCTEQPASCAAVLLCTCTGDSCAWLDTMPPNKKYILLYCTHIL